MPSLHQAVDETKGILKWGSIGLVLFLIAFFVVRTIVNYVNSTRPAAPPTVAFGKLPVISFPSQTAPSPAKYTIDTISGFLPVLPDRMNVYSIYQAPTNVLLALQNAQTAVTNLGFPDNGRRLTDTDHQWSDPQAPYRILQMNIFSKNFTLSSSFLTDPTVLLGQNVPDENSAIVTSQSFLSTLNNSPGDIDATKTTTLRLTLDNNNTLIVATNAGLTRFVQVDFFQQSVNHISIFYPRAMTSPMEFIVAGGTTAPAVVSAHFTHQIIQTTSATYPIKSAQAAFTELQNGSGYVAFNGNNLQTASIKEVFLAYYIGDDPQAYSLPIIVFKGDYFYAYVSAIKEEWLQK